MFFYPAAAYSAAALTSVLNASYRDYPVAIHFTPDQFDFFVRSHDIDLKLSVVAEHDGDLAGAVQLARRGDQGWVAGLGVRPEYRHSGVARGLMETVMANAAAAGLRQLRLEVLYQNEAALTLYQALGWQYERELLIWSRPPDQGLLPVPDEFLDDVAPAWLLEKCFGWHDQPPCWQRQRATLAYLDEAGLQGSALLREGQPVAYALRLPLEKHKLHLVDVAVDPAVGIRSAGRPLLQALYHLFPKATFQLQNEPVDSHLNPLFVALAYRVTQRQYEMVL